MFVKPVPGRKVRDPRTKQAIPETGIEVPDGDTYWTRRVLDGDVVVAKPAAAPSSKFAKE
jgi:hypothetical protein